MSKRYFSLVTGIACAAFLSVGLYSCGGGSSSSTTTSTSTTTPTSYTISGTLVSSKSPTLSRAVEYPYTIIAVSKDGEEIAEFNVNSDGYFQIDTSKLDNSTVLFVRDNNDNGTIIGDIKIKTLKKNYDLDHININDLVSNLNLGDINTDNLTAQYSIETCGGFSSQDYDNLTVEGASDNGMCLYQNNLNNPGIGAYLDVVIENNMDVSKCEESFCVVDTSKSKFKGAAPKFWIGSDNSSLYDNVTLEVPDNQTVGCKLRKHGMPEWCNGIQSDNFTRANKLTATAQYLPLAKVYTIEMPYVDTIPKGKWVLYNDKDNKTMGKFEFSFAYPYDNSTGTFLGLTPALKFNVSDNGTIESVYVKFYGVDNKTLDKEMVFNLINSDKGVLLSWVNNNSDVSNNFTLSAITDNGTVFEFVPPKEAYPTISNVNRFILGYFIGDEGFEIFVYPQSGGGVSGGAN